MKIMFKKKEYYFYPINSIVCLIIKTLKSKSIDNHYK